MVMRRSETVLAGRVRAAVVAWRRPLDSELRVVQEEVRELRREMQASMLQYNHLLGRLARGDRATATKRRAEAVGTRLARRSRGM